MSKPLVTVIIPTSNSEIALGQCLDSIMSQSYSNIETIIVDNYSIDRTREIAKNKAKIVLARSGRSKARNIGIDLAKGEFVLSIDSDMILSPRVIEECLIAINDNEKIGGVVIPEISVGSSFWVKVRDFERSFYAKTMIESARFFQKSLVEKVCGYDEDVIFFEESTLPLKIEKLGYSVKNRVDAEILHFEQNFSIMNWLQKKYYYGKSAFKYKEKIGESANKQISMIYRFSLFLKNKRFYSEPMLAFGVIVLKSLEYLSAGLGLLIGELKT